MKNIFSILYYINGSTTIIQYNILNISSSFDLYNILYEY